MGSTSKFSAIVHCKCPQCRRGDIFTGSLYGFDLQRTKEYCSHCSMRFEIEPGYFYAAMYVSYAMNVMEMITVGILTYILSGGYLEFESFWLYITTIFTGCLLLAPFNYRYSRVILLHWLTPKLKYNTFYDQP